MTSSYFESKGRSLDKPEDISKWNYDEEAGWGIVKNVNEQIDDYIEKDKRTADQLVQQYNEIFKNQEERGPVQLLQLTKQGIDTFNQVKAFTKFQQELAGYSKDVSLDEDKIPTIIKGGENWRQTLLNSDKDINAQNIAEAQNVALETEAQRIASEALKNGDINTAVEASNFNEVERAFNREGGRVMQLYPTYRKQSELGMPVDITRNDEWTGPTDKPIWKTYTDAVNARDEVSRRFIDSVIDGYFLFKHKDVTGGRLGKWKRDILAPLLQQRDLRTLAHLNAVGDATAIKLEENRQSQLWDGIKNDPTWLEKAIHISSASYGGDYSKGRGEVYGQLAAGLRTGVLEPDQVRNALSHPMKVRGQRKLVTPEQYWERESDELKKIIFEIEKERVNTAIEQTDAKNKAVGEKLAEEFYAGKDQSIEALLKVRENYSNITGITDPSQFPQSIKNLKYAGLKDDLQIERDLGRKWDKGLNISRTEVLEILDPDKRKKWIPKIGKGSIQQTLLNENDGAIRAIVNQKTGLKIGTDDTGNQEWQYYYRLAQSKFRNSINNAILINPDDLKGASKEGLTAVSNALGIPLYEGYEAQKGIDDTVHSNAVKASELLKKNDKLLSSKEYLPGEAPALNSAVDYLNNKEGSENVPLYFRKLAKNINRLPNGRLASPHALMLYRLEATGMLDEGEAKKMTLPEEENLSRRGQKLVLLKPNASKTLRALTDEDARDALWLLKTVADQKAINNGGYDAVQNKEGEYTELEKPLTEHTVGEVLGLIQQDYNNFGNFGITASGLVELVQDAKINLNSPFDKKTQNFLILARLRQKANRSNEYSSIYNQYRRLVNIEPELQKRFTQEVGELPQYLQLETLLPAVAKALVEQSTTK